MSQDFKHTLKRSAIAFLLLIVEIVVLLCLLGVRPGMIIGTIPATIMAWLIFSYLYSRFRSGGVRVVVAMWLGLCWALPLTLIYTETMLSDTPIPNFRKIVYNNLTLPALSILPTLYFIYTEQMPASAISRRVRWHLLGILLAFGGLCCMYHYRSQIPHIADADVSQRLSMTVDNFYESEKIYTVELRLTNHTTEAITLGHTEKSLRFNHLLHCCLVDGLWQDKHELLCMGHDTLFTITIPPHGCVTFTRNYQRPPKPHPRPNAVSFCFSYLRINSTDYSGNYTLHATISPTP